MSHKLLPCPFCGNSPRLISFKKGKVKHVIGCVNIECVIWLPEDISCANRANYVSGAWADVGDLIKSWNTRSGFTGN